MDPPYRAFRLFVIALALSASFCRRGGTTVDAPVSSTLTLAVRADVTGLYPNPPIQTESYTFDVNSNLFEGLIRFDRGLSPEPALAERWESPDDLTWIFTLRPGARFSDGSPVTAADVTASLEAARSKPWVSRIFLQAIESVKALDESRVQIRTRSPYTLLLSKLHYGFVLPAREMDKVPVAPIGAGPYRLESWTKGKELVLGRNARYRGGEAPFEKVRFEVVPDAKARILRVQTGKAQIADAIPLGELDALSRDARVRVLSAPGPRVLFLGYHFDEAPFSDPRVREAVDLAIDREELIRRALFNHAVPASQLVSPMVFGHDPDIAFTRPDRPRARRLLAEAGYPNGLAIPLDGPDNRYAGDVEILGEVARQLAEVGIRADAKSRPKEEWFPMVTEGRSRFFLMGWACETRDAGDALDVLMHTRTPDGLGAGNDERVSDKELDALIEKANVSPNLRMRHELLVKAVRRVAALHAVVPLVIQTETLLVSPSLAWEPPLNFGLRLFTRPR
ncbi:MAG TPA: ABC transporter substrate-binding protein [Thermoanaerobaculia bacterium]|nr:ABC transporter substrate-binding protein [Thermoanaerobaculia bacterium]